MTGTPISILLKATDLGLKLGVKSPDTLSVQSAEPWSSDFAETLRDHKPRLLGLLRLPFVTVYSEILNETIFFCKDEASKDALLKAGAEPWSIYTRDELRILVAQNRAKPFLPDELYNLHRAKRAFSARISS